MTTFIKWAVTLAMPFMLAFFMIGIAIKPWYPKWEYAKANFPADTFGWSQAQRLELGTVAVEFLRSKGSAEDTIHMLGDQTMPDSNQSLYTDAELGHMFDVKVRTNAIRRLAKVLSVIVVGGITFLLYNEETASEAYRSIRNGGLATFAILGIFALMIGLFWNWFFTTFHEVLFPQGNWTFAYSDSLIRLFPEKFWIDVGVVIVGGTLIAGTLIALIGHLLLRGAGLKQRA